MEKLENQMSNVKEAYELAFGPEGMNFTNLVVRTHSEAFPMRARIRDANDSEEEFLIAGYMIGKERIRRKFGYE